MPAFFNTPSDAGIPLEPLEATPASTDGASAEELLQQLAALNVTAQQIASGAGFSLGSEAGLWNVPPALPAWLPSVPHRSEEVVPGLPVSRSVGP